MLGNTRFSSILVFAYKNESTRKTNSELLEATWFSKDRLRPSERGRDELTSFTTFFGFPWSPDSFISSRIWLFRHSLQE
jgi:hypothetical protein